MPCNCEHNGEIARLLVNAAPLLGETPQSRRGAVGLAEAFAAVVELQRFFCGCAPLYPHPPPHDSTARFYRMAARCNPENQTLRQCRIEADIQYACKQLERHTLALCKILEERAHQTPHGPG